MHIICGVWGVVWVPKLLFLGDCWRGTDYWQVGWVVKNLLSIIVSYRHHLCMQPSSSGLLAKVIIQQKTVRELILLIFFLVIDILLT